MLIAVLVVITAILGAVRVSITTVSGNKVTGEYYNKINNVYHIKASSGNTIRIYAEDIVEVVDVTGADVTLEFLTTDNYLTEKPTVSPEYDLKPDLYPSIGLGSNMSYQQQLEIAKVTAQPLWLIGGSLAVTTAISLITFIIILQN